MRRRAVDERHRLAVEAGLPHHQPGGNLQARPAVAQDVDRQQRAAGNRVGVDAQVVIDARQRRVDRRRRRLAAVAGWRGRAARGTRRPEGRPSHPAALSFDATGTAANENTHTRVQRQGRGVLGPCDPPPGFDTGTRQLATCYDAPEPPSAGTGWIASE